MATHHIAHASRTLFVLGIVSTIASSTVAWSNVAWGQNTLTREHHSWARFKPGAWKQVKIVTETFDENGKLSTTSTTETRTSLLSVEGGCLTLKIASTHEVAGKKFEQKPRLLKQRLSGELDGQAAAFRLVGAGSVTVEGLEIPCNIQQLEVTMGNSRTVTKRFFSDTTPPFVLRTETTTESTSGAGQATKTVIEVFALDMPFRVLAEVKPTAHSRAIRKTSQGSTRTLLVSSMEVPGGVVAHSSKEVDVQGRLLRRSTLELVNYEAELAPREGQQAQPRRRIFGRLFRRRR